MFAAARLLLVACAALLASVRCDECVGQFSGTRITDVEIKLSPSAIVGVNSEVVLPEACPEDTTHEGTYLHVCDKQPANIVVSSLTKAKVQRAGDSKQPATVYATLYCKNGSGEAPPVTGLPAPAVIVRTLSPSSY